MKKKKTNEELEEIIKALEPLVKKVCMQTSPQNRRDLEQVLWYKIFQKIKSGTLEEPPGYFEFLSNLD